VFDLVYSESVPPWDTGKPQPELVHLAQTGGIGGTVLDIGCGSGENVLHLCEQGLTVCGADVSHKAIEIAKGKADERGLKPTFVVGDALNLARLEKTFDTVLDCGLFHVFTVEERKQLAARVASVLSPNGKYVILTISRDNGPGPWPHGESADEITEIFHVGWRLEFIRPARFQTRWAEPQARAGLRAWLASFSRLPSASSLSALLGT
jgi:cyclopropane fatty-acyl-phospholipid synthase-like methyltransferase